jgi:RNA polymerase sigma-70 factor (ECF subfamily)
MAETDWTGGEDGELVRRAQRGDREAFAGLVERHQRTVFALVSRLIRPSDLVEDLAQEIFLKVFRTIRSYNFRASFGTWLRRVSINHCYDYLRRQRISPVDSYGLPEDRESEEGGRNPSLQAVGETDPEYRAAVRDLVRKLLARAPADDREILVLKEIEGLSVEEISEALGLNVSTVKVRLHRARKRMLEDWRRWQKRV